MTGQTLTLVHDRLSDADTRSSILTTAIPTALICDNFLLRSGLRHILQDTPFDLAEAASEAGLLQHAALEPALILIDAHQTTGRMLEIIRQVRRHFPQARIVALADQFDLGFVRLGHEAGVDCFCLAANAPDVLIKSLELVMLGEPVLPCGLLRPIIDVALHAEDQRLYDNNVAEAKLAELKASKLSVREVEILGCLREGESNKAIARKLDIAEATIKAHVKAILRKIGASNRTQAAMWGAQRLPKRGATA